MTGRQVGEIPHMCPEGGRGGSHLQSTSDRTAGEVACRFCTGFTRDVASLAFPFAKSNDGIAAAFLSLWRGVTRNG